MSITGPLTTRFPLMPTRQRPTVREQLKVASVTAGPLRFVREERAESLPVTAGDRYSDTPEAGFLPRLAEAGLTGLSVRVAIPEEICTDPAMLARFVDHRVIVRLCTLENEVLLHGSADNVITGLLRLEGLRKFGHAGGLSLAGLLAAAADVEEMGGSCDGLVMHPRAYWQLVAEGALPALAAAGLCLTRTRMIPPDEVLLGDFHAGATVLDAPASTLALTHGGGGAQVEAHMRIGLAVQLPQHFLLFC